MQPFSVMFENQGTDQIEYNGKIVRQSLVYENFKQVNLTFTNVKSKSKYLQAIVFFFEDDFDGTIRINNHEVTLAKREFPGMEFWAFTMPPKVTVSITFNKGKLRLCNGADQTNTMKYCDALTFGFAFYLEELGDNEYVVHCNDFENDDDFDDLVFNMHVECTPNE